MTDMPLSYDNDLAQSFRSGSIAQSSILGAIGVWGARDGRINTVTHGKQKGVKYIIKVL